MISTQQVNRVAAIESATVDSLLAVFERFRKPSDPEIDRYYATGRAALGARIREYVNDGGGVKFLLPGFPAKSPNSRDKVLGTLPDKAEEVAFNQIGVFLGEVKKVYTPGAEFHILSDGYVFGDIVGVPDDTVSEYQAAARKMTEGLPIVWHDLDEFFPGASSRDEMRKSLMERYGVTPEELASAIATCEDTRLLLCGMNKFMMSDIQWDEGMSKTAVRNAAKEVAKRMMLRNGAYSNLIDERFEGVVRLSVHPSTNYGHKFSFRLIPEDDGWCSPWHRSMLVRQDGTYELVRKIDAERAGHLLVYQNGRPYSFAERPKV